MPEAKKEATKIRDLNERQALYRLSAPVAYSYHGHTSSTDYVVVSVSRDGDETFLFPASPDGEVLNWLELYGSSPTPAAHGDVLAAAGFPLI
jgi:hypothetical protein